MRLFRHLLFLTLFLACLGFGLSISTDRNGLSGDPVRGGKLYDNWMVQLDLRPPQSDQPLWDEQSSNARSGRVTWRCKECHGWDYKGAEGNFGPNSLRFTGFPGVTDSVGSSLEEITAWLNGVNNPDHNFLAISNPVAVDDLAAFLLTMQIDTNLLIHAQTGLSYGDEKAGSSLFAANCAECHGNDGRRINFSAAGSPVYLGDVAVVDPWRTIHKIRFGLPGGTMPASEEQGWALSQVADVLAFMQSLPRGNPNYRISRPDGELQSIEAQGEMEPIILGTILMVTIVAISLGWDQFERRPRR